jgi:hypothetical protein
MGTGVGLYLQKMMGQGRSLSLENDGLELVGTNGTNGDKWRTNGKAICPDNREDKWGVGL